MNSSRAYLPLAYCLLSSIFATIAAAQIEVSSNSNTGVGTTTPNFKLDVAIGGEQYALPALNIMPSSHSTSERATIGFGFTSASITDGWIMGQDFNGSGTRDFYLLQRSGGTSTTRFFIGSSGNVGIGTAVPQEKLEIAGNVFLNPADKHIKIFANTENVDAIVFARSDNSHQASIATTAWGKSILFKVGGSEIVRFRNDGNVGIGTNNPGYKLQVAGSVRASSFISDTTTYADFVFSPDYKLPSLSEVEAHIKERGHLPDIPSEAEVKEHGLDLAAMQVKLLQKIEELTLHQIAQEKRLNEQVARINALEEENKQLRDR